MQHRISTELQFCRGHVVVLDKGGAFPGMTAEVTKKTMGPMVNPTSVVFLASSWAKDGECR